MLEGVSCKKMQYLQFANGKKRSFFYLYFDMRPHYEKDLTSKSLGVCIIAFLLIDRRHYQYSIHFLASVCYHKPKNWVDDCFPMTFSNHLQRCFALHIEITQLIERLGLQSLILWELKRSFFSIPNVIIQTFK